jgi:putative nucleotidyltransferase with HDIG domain
MAFSKKLVANETKIKKVILSGLPLTITTFTLPHEIEIYIGDIINILLKLAGQERLKEHINYCVMELATNAKKANTKRVYFDELSLNLTNPDDYQKGMEHFKNTTLDNINHYLQMQKEKGLYIKLILQVRGNTIYIEVRNNAAATDSELSRIQDRLANARQYDNLDEAFTQVLDSSEGAGLGLVILVLMLKKMDLTEDCLKIQSNKKETVARLMIPLDQVHVQNLSVLSEAIVSSISSLPQFPENILEIQRLINNKDTDMADIARRLSMDPALTADLLRISNSAQYMHINPIDNIFDAVKMIGIRGIKNLMYSYGTQIILGNDTTEKKQLWEHCYKTAYYAFFLIKNFKPDSGYQDDAFISGMLHDIGKIIFSNVHPNLLEKIKKFCTERNIPNSTFEDLSAGMNHAEIAAHIAKKWNFPENLIQAIGFHHNPLAAPKDCRDLVDGVYLANMFCEYENGNVTFDQFEQNPLINFTITSKDKLESLIERLSQSFKKANE